MDLTSFRQPHKRLRLRAKLPSCGAPGPGWPSWWLSWQPPCRHGPAVSLPWHPLSAPWLGPFGPPGALFWLMSGPFLAGAFLLACLLLSCFGGLFSTVLAAAFLAAFWGAAFLSVGRLTAALGHPCEEPSSDPVDRARHLRDGRHAIDRLQRAFHAIIVDYRGHLLAKGFHSSL